MYESPGFNARKKAASAPEDVNTGKTGFSLVFIRKFCILLYTFIRNR